MKEMVRIRRALQSGGEAVNITGSIGATAGSGYGRESHKSRSLLAGSAEERGSGDIAPVTVARKRAVRSSTSGVDCALRYLRYA